MSGSVANYGTMQSRIADEVLGNVTTTHITNAIQDAIRKYERRRFWFNETRYDDGSPVQDSTGADVMDPSGYTVFQSPVLSTLVGQEYYDTYNAPPLGSMVHIDTLILVQGYVNRFVLRPRSSGWMDNAAISDTWRGMPTDWCYVAERLRLYPTPDQVYPILLQGTGRFATLINTTDTNPWMVQAEELIRTCAEGILYRRITRDVDGAQVAQQDEMQALASLNLETFMRLGPARVTIKTYF